MFPKMTASGKLGISYHMSQQVTDVQASWIDLLNPCMIEFGLEWIGCVDDEQVNDD